jgi:hypothetical protein
MEADLLGKGLASKSALANARGRGLITDGRLVEPLEPCLTSP